MPRRRALIIEAGGERFRFYYDVDVPEVLHIAWQHGTTPTEAIQAFFATTEATWNERHERYESLTDAVGLYWTRHAHDGSVIVITCFRRGE